MDVLDKFLHSIAYKFKKGYPDINNIQDIILLEGILEKMGVGLYEEKTTATEDLHEIFTAMFIAGHNRLSDNDFAEMDVEKEIKSLNKLNNPSDHINTLNKYKDKFNDPKVRKIYDDAEKVANIIKRDLGYSANDSSLIGVERVFGVGDTGGKIIIR